MMNKVVIRRCPVCGEIGARAREVQAALQGVPGLSVEVADGQKGEFTVLVDGQEATRKRDALPSVDEVATAVKEVAMAHQPA